MWGNFWTWLVAILIGIPIWQHYGRMHGLRFRPGTILSTLADGCEWFWEQLGKAWAFVSNFLNWINLKEFWVSMKEMFTGLSDIVMSFRYFKVAYDTAASLYDNPWLVRVGSWTLACLVVALCFWKGQWLLSVCPQWLSQLGSNFSRVLRFN